MLSTSTGRAPRCTTTCAHAAKVYVGSSTSSPGPMSRCHQRQVQRRCRAVERHRMGGARVLREALFQLLGARSGRDPAAAQRLDHRRDLFFINRGLVVWQVVLVHSGDCAAGLADHGEQVRSQRRQTFGESAASRRSPVARGAARWAAQRHPLQALRADRRRAARSSSTPMPCVSRLVGLTVKSYHSATPPGRSTRSISSAAARRTFTSRIELNAVNCETSAKLPPERQQIGGRPRRLRFGCTPRADASAAGNASTASPSGDAPPAEQIRRNHQPPPQPTSSARPPRHGRRIAPPRAPAPTPAPASAAGRGSPRRRARSNLPSR